MKRHLLAAVLALLPGAAMADPWGAGVPVPVLSPDSNHRERTCMGAGPYVPMWRINACTTYMHDHPGEASAWGFLAMAYEEAGDLPNAVDAISHAIQIQPWPNRYRLRAIYHAEAGDRAAAMADVDALVALHDGPMGWTARCLVRAILGSELETALADCGKALDVQKKTGDPLMARGLAYFKLGQLQAAQADYSRAAALEPDNGEALFMRGTIARLLGGAGDGDIAAGQRADPGAANRLLRYGVKPAG